MQLPIGVQRILAVASLEQGVGIEAYMESAGVNHYEDWLHHALGVAEQDFLSEYADIRNEVTSRATVARLGWKQS